MTMPMWRFRNLGALQKFAAAHASIHNHFNHDRHLNRRDILKQTRSAALAEWRQLASLMAIASRPADARSLYSDNALTASTEK